MKARTPVSVRVFNFFRLGIVSLSVRCYTRDMEGITIVSVGGGQDSTAILYKIGLDPAFRAKYAPGHVLAIMADTGDEHDETTAHRETLAHFCAAHAIEWVWLDSNGDYHSGPWKGGLAAFYRNKNAIGSQAYPKTCTDNLKVQPIYRFVAEYLARFLGASPALAERKQSLYAYAARYGKLRVLIGIARGEESRMDKGPAPCKDCLGHGSIVAAGMPLQGLWDRRETCATCKGTGKQPPRSKWMAECVEKVYPLVEEGMDRADCQAYIKSTGMALPPPSNCFMCPFKSPIEILWTARTNRARFDVWVALEARKIAANADVAKNYGVFKTKLLPQVLADAEREYADWSDDRLNAYRMSHGHCVTSAY